MSDKHVRPFAEFLQEQRGGAAHNEVSDAFNELVAAVQQYAKPGELTLTIKVKPAATGGGTVFVTDKVTLKAPEGDRPAALFFIDADANLSRRDPNQPELPGMRVIEGAHDPEHAEEAQ